MPSCRPSLPNRIRHYFKGPNPLHPAVWEGRLSPIIFRRLQAADIPQCLELYKLNEPGRFPEGMLNHYEKCLKEQSGYYLVAEINGKIHATGGISYSRRPYLAMLSYGLVSPSAQGNGIGTALLMARLALLKDSEPVYHVLICAIAKSLSFYMRFGFRQIGNWKDIHDQEHPVGSLVITYAEAQKCRSLLTAHGIVVPNDEEHVPFRNQDNETSDFRV